MLLVLDPGHGYFFGSAKTGNPVQVPFIGYQPTAEHSNNWVSGFALTHRVFSYRDKRSALINLRELQGQP